MNFQSNENLKRLCFVFLGLVGLSLFSIVISLLGFSKWLDFVYISPIERSTQEDGYFTFLVYAVGLLVALLLLGKDKFVEIGSEFTNKNKIKEGITIGILIIAFSLLYGFIIQLIFPIESNQNEVQIDNMTINTPIRSLILTVFFAPIFEELAYRYGLFGFLKLQGRFLAYLGTILIFSLIHFNFSSNPSTLLNECLNLPSYMFAAGALSYAYDKFGLASSITAHALNNFIAFIFTFI